MGDRPLKHDVSQAEFADFDGGNVGTGYVTKDIRLRHHSVI